jgi:hypothetical protein
MLDLNAVLEAIDRRIDAKRDQIRRDAAIEALTIVRDVVLPIIHDALNGKIAELKEQS